MTRELVAFVAGATSHVGRHLVPSLVEREVRTVAHVRPDSEQLAEWRARFASCHALLSEVPFDLQGLTLALRELAPSHVFMLIGTNRARMRDGQGDYEAVDYGLTRVLLDACLASEAKPRFVYVSSAGTRAKSVGGYLQARWKAEQAVRHSSLPYTIVRPTWIRAQERQAGRLLAPLALKAVDTLLGMAGKLGARGTSARYRPIDAPELAEGIARAALNYTTIDRTLENEELRRESANDRRYYEPCSKRDWGRH